MTLVSSAFVPTDAMPAPVRAFAEHQSVTAVVGTLRSLLDGRPAGSDAWTAFAWCAATAILGYVLAMRADARIP